MKLKIILISVIVNIICGCTNISLDKWAFDHNSHLMINFSPFGLWIHSLYSYIMNIDMWKIILIIILFVVGNIIYNMKQINEDIKLKKIILRYFEYPLVAYLSVLTFLFQIMLMPSYRDFFKFEHKIRLLDNIGFLLCCIIIPPILYKLYKRKWKDAVFLLFVPIISFILFVLWFWGIQLISEA